MRTRIFPAALLLGLAAHSQPAVADADGARLLAQVRRDYPSLAYVERYHQAYPGESQGDRPFWRQPANTLDTRTPRSLTRALVELEDQHVALAGPKAGRSETLGVLFRTASDGSLAIWRVFDPTLVHASPVERPEPGERVLTINGMPARDWLRRAATLTFGGQRRSRYAEAATELGLATAVVHRVAGLGEGVTLHVRNARGASRTLRLRYHLVDAAMAAAMAAAVNRPDLPATIRAGGLRVATVRLGAFAPQFDPVFRAAADHAGGDDDRAMLAGYCAVIRHFIGQVDAATGHADVLVLDLRGNLGGFDREARLLAESLAAHPLPATLDLFAIHDHGKVRLQPEPTDPSCGHVRTRVPLVVWVDAGTRSAGEFEAAWLWGAGAVVIGERTIGAGGGFEFGGQPAPALAGSGYSVRLSGNFSVFDPTGALHAGRVDEAALVDQLAREGFAPSHSHPFAIQSAGLHPDLAVETTATDLDDGGRRALTLALGRLRAQGHL